MPQAYDSAGDLKTNPNDEMQWKKHQRGRRGSAMGARAVKPKVTVRKQPKRR